MRRGMLGEWNFACTRRNSIVQSGSISKWKFGNFLAASTLLEIAPGGNEALEL